MPHLLLALTLLLAACAPRLMPMGPATAEPTLRPGALVAADGFALPLRVWHPEGPPRAVLLGLHGLNDYSGRFLDDGAALLTAGGVLVYAYDQRGFGRNPRPGIWPGDATLVADATAAVQALRARHPDLPLFLLGESMGGAVALLVASAEPPPPLDGVITLAPALTSWAAIGPVAAAVLRFGAHTLPGLGFRAASPGLVASDNEAALRRMGEDPLVIKEVRVDAAFGLVGLMDKAAAVVPRCCAMPALLLFGANDRLVVSDSARTAMRTLPRRGPARLGLYENGWHLLLRDRVRETVAGDILAFIAAPRAALPSGAEAAGRAWLARTP